MMAELANCSRCDTVFVKNIRNICQTCYQEVEKSFDTVYRFLNIRENKEATLPEIVKATSVAETLIIKFIKEKRLRTSQFPKLAYPCEKCDVPIVSGKLCNLCSEKILSELAQHEKIAEQTKEKNENPIYYAMNKHKK